MADLFSLNFKPLVFQTKKNKDRGQHRRRQGLDLEQYFGNREGFVAARALTHERGWRPLGIAVQAWGRRQG
jgi:hypothetical protein